MFYNIISKENFRIISKLHGLVYIIHDFLLGLFFFFTLGFFVFMVPWYKIHCFGTYTISGGGLTLFDTWLLMFFLFCVEWRKSL